MGRLVDGANWFVAIPIEASDWFSRVGEPPPGIRRFAPEDLHLTLAFLGAVGEDAARAAFERARAIPLAPCEVQLGALVPMGAARRFSALSAHLSQGEATVAAAIMAVRDDVCDAAGARRDLRPALPHLTLARPTRKATQSERAEALRWARALELGAPRVQLDSVALYTWFPERRERLFQIVDRCALASSPGAP